MARYQIILAYDGTRYQGFQRQRDESGGLTIQAVFEAALGGLGWTDRSILAAGRTDSGVHASGQVVAFDLEWRHSPEDLQGALNAALPGDVVVQTARLAAPGFHPRYDAVSRRYRYRLYCRPVPDPLRERYAWRAWPELDLEVLQETASLLTGSHDFAAFGTPPRSGGGTVRRILATSWQAERDELVFDITGDAFLYRMVRRLVYVQISVGEGRLALEQLRDYLDRPPRFPLQGLAPAQGLVLVEVSYPPEAVYPESANLR